MKLSAANVHDSKLFETMVDALEPIRRPRGRPRKRPDKLHADKGYDYPRCRKALTARDIRCGSPDAELNPVKSWGVTVGWWSGRIPGSIVIVGSEFATNDATISMTPFKTLVVHSSAGTFSYRGFVRRS